MKKARGRGSDPTHSGTILTPLHTVGGTIDEVGIKRGMNSLYYPQEKCKTSEARFFLSHEGEGDERGARKNIKLSLRGPYLTSTAAHVR